MPDSRRNSQSKNPRVEKFGDLPFLLRKFSFQKQESARFEPRQISPLPKPLRESGARSRMSGWASMLAPRGSVYGQTTY